MNLSLTPPMNKLDQFKKEINQKIWIYSMSAFECLHWLACYDYIISMAESDEKNEWINLGKEL